MQQMETMVAKEGVHTQCSSSSTMQDGANNGEFSNFFVLCCTAARPMWAGHKTLTPADSLQVGRAFSKRSIPNLGQGRD